MPLVQTRGAASAQGFGEFAQVTAANYIEDVFSTYLYTGTAGAQTITNNIDLSTKGGLIWTKSRSDVRDNSLTDTAQGVGTFLVSNKTEAANTPSGITSFNTNGYTLDTGQANTNQSTWTYASWTFREQPKFFDVVTYTGNGSDPRNISHSLGSVPGCIIIKCTSTGSTDWFVYHRSLGNTQSLNLNQDVAAETGTGIWGSTTPTSTVFTVGNINSNTNGRTYVAYIFAHDAGGFGLTGLDNVISCGSYAGNATVGNSVTLGYEPQWLMVKPSSRTGDWIIVDNMRSFSETSNKQLYANSSAAEDTGLFFTPTATGFKLQTTSVYANGSGQTYIYIAIRRGPMKVPTTGTSVFSPDLYTGNGTTQTVTSGSPPLDLVWIKGRTGSNNPRLYDRLRGATKALAPDSTAAESTRSDGLTAFTQNGFSVGSFGNENESGVSIIAWDFRRAPGFFDEVCYTGTGANRTVTHNLTVAPELMITKSRSGAYDWAVYAAGVGNTSYGLLNDPGQFYVDSSAWNNTSPTSSVFTVGTGTYMNGSGATYVAYLFATCAGVSKVGSYTGTGTTKQIDCGFTAGARFVLIKRTDSTGDWYVWDSARGIVAGNDPYLLLNTSTNEVTGTDYVDTYSAGFEISSTAPAAINASAGTFLFLAIA